MLLRAIFFSAVALSSLSLYSCGRGQTAAASAPQERIVTVGVVKAARHPLERNLTIAADLVPFQEIDVYAKEAGYISKLLVDYGSHVKQGQQLAVLEIPELQAQIRQDQASVKSMADQVRNAESQLSRTEAQHKVLHLQYERFNGVAQSKPGLVAQQEIDDVQARDLAAEAQVEAARSNLDVAHSNQLAAQSKLERDQDVYSYSRITAPFTGVVTQRYANLGALVQAATPIVKLSQENLYRLVIPVAETYVGLIKIGDPVSVHVSSLDQSFTGRVSRISFDVHDETKTMHTEVDVPNPKGTLLPGMYAEATITLSKNPNAITIPLTGVERESNRASVDIVDSSNKVQIRQVVLGTENENDVEIRSGLQEGEQVVVSDRASLKPGQEVRAIAALAPEYRTRS